MLHVLVAGTGSVGGFVGGLLAAHGHRVTLLGRPAALAAIEAAGGLRLTGLHADGRPGLDLRVGRAALTLATDPADLPEPDVILVTVKSRDTAALAAALAARFGSAPVVSLQNGVAHLPVLRAAFGPARTVAGMIPFNVVSMGNGRFHRGTGGGIVLDARAGALASGLATSELPLRTDGHIERVLWGKLLVNLNNALNALSGLPLRAQLLDRGWRRLYADQIDEARGVLAASGIAPISPFPISAANFARLLRLPTPLFAALARRSLAMDEEARSSMWEDLERRRPTEIDVLQGEILRLAASSGGDAPVIAAIASLVAAAEAAGQGSPGLTAAACRAAVLRRR